jgi:hypothetical protein
MTTAQRNIHTALETRDRLSQATMEAAALSGELGLDAMLIAMSQAYMDLRAAGRFEEARAMKLRAIALNAARS